MLSFTLLCSWIALVASLPGPSSPRNACNQAQIGNVLQSQHLPAKLCADIVPLKKRGNPSTLKHGHHKGEDNKVNHQNKSDPKQTQSSSKGTKGSSPPTEHASDACVVTDMDSHRACQGKMLVVVDDMTVPALTTLAFNMAKGAQLTISGTIKFNYGKWKGPLISISGQDVKVNGQGIIDGGGPQYWGNKVDDGSKPDCLWLHQLYNSKVQDITVKNTPIQAVSVLASHLDIINVNIDNSLGNKYEAQNTDGFDIGRSEYVNINGGIITTQDDAVVVNDGKHIHITGVVAYGTHGFSIGVSTGTVLDVTVSDCTVNGGSYGVRVKTSNSHTADGVVQGITWQNNKFNDIKEAAIAILQNYNGQKSSGLPGSGVSIADVKVSGNTGSSNGKAVQIVCAACKNFYVAHDGITGAVEVSGISISGKSKP